MRLHHWLNGKRFLTTWHCETYAEQEALFLTDAPHHRIRNSYDRSVYAVHCRHCRSWNFPIFSKPLHGWCKIPWNSQSQVTTLMLGLSCFRNRTISVMANFWSCFLGIQLNKSGIFPKIKGKKINRYICFPFQSSPRGNFRVTVQRKRILILATKKEHDETEWQIKTFEKKKKNVIIYKIVVQSDRCDTIEIYGSAWAHTK